MIMTMTATVTVADYDYDYEYDYNYDYSYEILLFGKTTCFTNIFLQSFEPENQIYKIRLNVEV